MVIPGKLKSRKLWITLLSAGSLFLAGDINQATAIILGYIGIQGVVDAACKLKKV